MSDAKALMVDGAIEAFREHGVSATSLNAITDRSGAPRGSVYHYFPGGKPQLAAEAVTVFGRRTGAAISLLGSAEDFEQVLAAMIAAYREALITSDYTRSCPVAAAAIEGEVTPLARAAAGESFSAWEAALTAVLWQKGATSDTAKELASLLIAALEGAAIMAKAQRDTGPLDRIERPLAAILRAEFS